MIYSHCLTQHTTPFDTRLSLVDINTLFLTLDTPSPNVNTPLFDTRPPLTSAPWYLTPGLLCLTSTPYSLTPIPLLTSTPRRRTPGLLLLDLNTLLYDTRPPSDVSTLMFETRSSLPDVNTLLLDTRPPSDVNTLLFDARPPSNVNTLLVHTCAPPPPTSTPYCLILYHL